MGYHLNARYGACLLYTSYLAETLRYFLAGKHYRSPIDFSLDNMDESERSQKRVYECLREVDKALARENWKPGAAPAERCV